MLIERVGRDTAAEREWRAYVAVHPDATPYHELPWRDIFQRGFGYASWHLIARESAGGPVRGILPLFLVCTPFSRRLVAVPFRDRGGVLWDTPEAFEALVARAREIGHAEKASSIRLKSLHAYPDRQTRGLGVEQQCYWVHSVVDLRGLDAELLWRRIGDKNRNMVRQAQRQGFLCEQREPDGPALHEWHRLHVTSQKRLGIPPFPARFFVAMAEELRATGGLALYAVRREGGLHAATIVLRHGSTAIYAYSASDATGQLGRANDLMLYEVMKSLLADGCTRFDLGSDSPRQESLLFFKRKWLAQQSVIPHYSIGPAAPLDSSDGRYALARRLFAALPARVLAPVGSAITRYFG